MDQNFEILWNGYTVCPPGWGMRNANESFHRIYYVYGGEAFYQDAGGTRPLEAGHLYILPILHPYTMYHNPHCPLDVLWFHVETPVLLCTQLHDLTIEPGTLPFHLLESIRFLANNLDQLPLLRQLFGVFLTLLMQLTQTAPYPGAALQAVLDYIDGHLAEDLRVERLAAFAGMERSYFSRKFKSVLQISPNQYILSRKMRVAARALTGGASIYEAAKSCGYRDEKAFSRAFKKYMEVSPAYYRDRRTLQP